MQEGRLLSAAAATSARGGRGGGGGLCVMRIKRLSPEERERAVADKEINEKKVGEREGHGEAGGPNGLRAAATAQSSYHALSSLLWWCHRASCT